MQVRDIYGSKLILKQSKAGAIIVPFASRFITLNREDAERFCLYDIEDFSQDDFIKFYGEGIR